MICIAMRNKNIIQLFYSLRFQKRNNSILPDFRDIAAASIYKNRFLPIGVFLRKNSLTPVPHPASSPETPRDVFI